MHTHLQTIQNLYQAFGQGDVPTILQALDPDVQWESWADNSAQKAGVATLQARRGRDAVIGFFQAVGQLQIHDFQLLDIIAGERQVACEVVIEFSNPATGARVRDEELHLWTFGTDGKVTRMRHYVDTAKHIRAA